MIICIKIWSQIVFYKSSIIPRSLPFIIIKMRISVWLKTWWICRCPQWQVFSSNMCSCWPRRFSFLTITLNTVCYVHTPSKVGVVWSFIISIFPCTFVVVINTIWTWNCTKSNYITNYRCIRCSRIWTNVAPPSKHRTCPRKKLLKTSCTRIRIYLISRICPFNCD